MPASSQSPPAWIWSPANAGALTFRLRVPGTRRTRPAALEGVTRSRSSGAARRAARAWRPRATWTPTRWWPDGRCPTRSPSAGSRRRLGLQRARPAGRRGPLGVALDEPVDAMRGCARGGGFGRCQRGDAWLAAHPATVELDLRRSPAAAAGGQRCSPRSASPSAHTRRGRRSPRRPGPIAATAATCGCTNGAGSRPALRPGDARLPRPQRVAPRAGADRDPDAGRGWTCVLTTWEGRPASVSGGHRLMRTPEARGTSAVIVVGSRTSPGTTTGDARWGRR